MVQVISVLVAILSVQLGASVAKQMFPIVGAIGATSLRISLAALMLGIIWRPWREKLTGKELRLVFIYGAALGVMNLLFYQALTKIPLGIAVALEFTGPLCVALASSRRALDFLWAGLAVIGIILILPLGLENPGGLATHSLDLMGVAYALGAGCGWAFYIIFGQRLGATVPGGRATALGMIVAAVIAMPIGLFQSGLGLFSWNILPIALFVAVFSSALPYSLEMSALKKIPMQTFSILMSLEPAIGAIFGFFFLHETLSFTQFFAIGCIVAASAGSALTINERKNLSDSTLAQGGNGHPLNEP